MPKARSAAKQIGVISVSHCFAFNLLSQEPKEECEKTFVEARTSAKQNWCHFTIHYISLLVFVSDLSSQEPKECEKTFAEARSAAKQDWFISLVFVSDLS